MRKIRDVLRLNFEARLSHVRTAIALQISKGVVTKYLTLATAAGLVVQPDYGRIHQELRRKGMTLMLLWQEHGAQHPAQSTHRHSRCFENYRHYAKSLKRSMRQVYHADEKLFIDCASPMVELTDGT